MLLLDNLFAAPLKEPLKHISLALDWTPNTHHTGFYVALDKNYYKDVGLDLHIVLPKGVSPLFLIAQKKTEFAVSFAFDIAKAQDQGLPVSYLAGLLEKNTACFAWRKSSQIKTPKNWENKRFVGLGTPDEFALIEDIMERYQGDVKKVKFISSSYPDFVKMTEKEADFLLIFEGWELIHAKSLKIPYDKLCLRDVAPHFKHPSPLLVTHKDQDPVLIKKFLLATKKGYEFSKKFPKESLMSLLKFAPELKNGFISHSQDFMSQYYGSPWGCESPKKWVPFMNWMFQKKIIQRVMDFPLNNSTLPCL